MITQCANVFDTIHHFRCITADITASKHIPNENGIMVSTGTKLDNGDELYNMSTGDVYIYDEENKEWLLQ